jgi:hypothetical protein
LYVQGRGGLRAELTRYLRLQHKTRKSPDGRGHIRDQVHISQRRPKRRTGRCRAIGKAIY